MGSSDSFWIATLSVSVSILSVIVTLYLNRTNRKYLETNALNELRNKWLKSHYDEIIEKMNRPYAPITNSMPVNSLEFFQPWLGALTIKDEGSLNIKISNDYGRHFITDKNLYQHIEDRNYKTILEKLTKATEDLEEYAYEFNNLISDIIVRIKDTLLEFVPDAKPTNNYDPTKHEFIMSNLFNSIISQLTSAITNQTPSSFLEMSDDPKLPMLRIWDRFNGSAITVPKNFPKLVELKNRLDCIHKEYIGNGRNLYAQNMKIRDKWAIFTKALEEIQTNYKKSGIPLDGQCDICKRTKEAESLMPLD